MRAQQHQATKRQRSLTVVLALALVVLGAGRGFSPGVHALYARSAVIDDDFDADILDPPTALALSVPVAGTVSLTWSRSAAPYASSTQVLRATTSGGPYALIANLSPSVTGFTDAPGIGSFFYVVRVGFQNWLSVNSNEVTTAFTSLSTPWFNCTAQGPDAGGDGNGYQTNPGSACGDDGVMASDPNSGTNTNTGCTNAGKDKHHFNAFNIALPGTATIRGIEVRTQSAVTTTGNTNRICVRLSADNGATWTATQQVAIASAAETVLSFGSTSNLWGRAWTAAQLTGAGFRVQVIDVSNRTNKTFSLDTVQVRVTYS